MTQNRTPQQNPTQQVNSNKKNLPYESQTEIYKEVNGVLTRATSGKVILEETKIVITANVTKEVLYKDVFDVHIEKNFFIFLQKAGQFLLF